MNQHAIQLTCQILLAIGLFLSFCLLTVQDFEGRKAKPPEGIKGWSTTIIAMIITVVIYLTPGHST